MGKRVVRLPTCATDKAVLPFTLVRTFQANLFSASPNGHTFNISGHGPFAYHQSLIEPSIDPTCRFCSLEGKETFHHLMYDCPALAQRRADLFSQFQLPANFDWTPSDILSFINNTYLAEIFELVKAPSHRDTSSEISVRSGSCSEDEEIF